MKGVVAVVVSVLWFRNPISLYGMLGYGVTVGGVVAYSQVRLCHPTEVRFGGRQGQGCLVWARPQIDSRPYRGFVARFCTNLPILCGHQHGPLVEWLRPAHAQAKRRATANSAKEKQAALVAGGHASEDEEAPLVRQPLQESEFSSQHETVAHDQHYRRQCIPCQSQVHGARQRSVSASCSGTT